MQVDCKAGYSVCDYPKSFNWQGSCQSVRHINKEWREPGAKHYLVTAGSGSCFKLTFSETSGSWSIVEVSGSPNP